MVLLHKIPKKPHFRTQILVNPQCIHEPIHIKPPITSAVTPILKMLSIPGPIQSLLSQKRA